MRASSIQSRMVICGTPPFCGERGELRFDVQAMCGGEDAERADVLAPVERRSLRRVTTSCTNGVAASPVPFTGDGERNVVDDIDVRTTGAYKERTPILVLVARRFAGGLRVAFYGVVARLRYPRKG